MIGHYSYLEIIAFFVLVIACLTIDLFAHKKDEPITAKSAAIWSVLWTILAFLFAGYIGLRHTWGESSLFVTAYLLERSLSMDNLFVMMAIFASFSVPDKFQHRVLFYGILGALFMRMIFIAAGTGLIKLFGPYALGAFAIFVLWSAWKMWQAMISPKEEIVDYSNHFSVRWTRKIIPVHTRLAGHDFFTKLDGKYLATPLLLCLIVIEMADVMFAFDSVPAVMTITQDPFLVYTSNVFAILGMRALFFLLAAGKRFLKHLEKAIILILVFIGGKMLFEIIQELLAHADIIDNVVHIGHAWNLIVVGVLLTAGVVASVLDKRDEAPANDSHNTSTKITDDSSDKE